MKEFPYKTEPFQHQRDALGLSARREFFGIHLEQGLGKSKVFIDTAAYLYRRGRIRGMVVVAPNGVHTNWAEDEIPKHMTDEVEWRVLEWQSGKSSNKSFLREFEELIDFPGLACFCVNIEATRTSRGKAAIKRFLDSRESIMGVDESTDIKSPGAKQSRSIHFLGRRAKFRRTMTGTPAGDGTPFDIYSQFKFLSPELFGTSFTAFKNRFAEMVPAPWENAPKHLKVVKRYKNLDQLNRILAQHTIRLTKDELIAAGVLDIPPKLYTKHYIDLSPQQRKLYADLRDDFIAQFPEGDDDWVVAEFTMVRYLRLQQVINGYVPVEGDDEPARLIPGGNPRVEMIEGFLERNPGKAIIWGRFRLDLDLIEERYSREHGMVRMDGTVGRDLREEARDRFQNDPDTRILLANAAVAGRGYTLTQARHCLIYSNYFSLERRLQLEDRPHRIGLLNPVLYTDLVARGTIDERIVKALRNKKNVSDIITGDPRKDWI
jgi:SNF2 family DNA or RNA helicase